MINKLEADKIEIACKNATKKIRECIEDDCICKTINSHFAPKKQWLVQLGGNFYYRLERAQFYRDPIPSFKFKKRGSKEVMSLQMFCKEHDDVLFSSIEKSHVVDYTDEEVQRLISYRTVCAVLRQSEINRDIFEQLGRVDGVLAELLVQDKYWKLKNILQKATQNSFVFELVEHDFIGICVSNIWEYIGEGSGLIVNVFPNSLNSARMNILIAYKRDEYRLLVDKINLLKDKRNIKRNLTYFMISFPENWVMSENLYDSIAGDKVDLFLRYLIVDNDEYRRSEAYFSIFD